MTPPETVLIPIANRNLEQPKTLTKNQPRDADDLPDITIQQQDKPKTPQRNEASSSTTAVTSQLDQLSTLNIDFIKDLSSPSNRLPRIAGEGKRRLEHNN